MIDDRECPDEVNHCFFGELICTELDIDIPILLFIVMISEYTIHHSPDILFIIVDSDFYLISSCEDGVHDKILRELLFQIGIEYIDHSLQLYPIVSVESDGGSRSLSFGFFPFESVFDHIVLSDWWYMTRVYSETTNIEIWVVLLMGFFNFYLTLLSLSLYKL